MEIFDTSKSLIENLYLLSGPILALLGFLIFKQIILTKEQLKISKQQLAETQKHLLINSSRDSIKLSAKQVKYYMDTVVAYSNDAYQKYKELDITRIKIQTTRFIKDDIFNLPNLEEIIDYIEKTKETVLYDLKIMNALETFSIFFVEKVSDEKVAFQSVGKSYCDTVESLSFSLSAVRDTESSYFKNIIILYRLWKNRIEKQSLEVQKEALQAELLQRIHEIDSTLKKTPQSIFEPIGTR